MTKASAPNQGDNASASSTIRPISPTIAIDSVIVDRPDEKVDMKSLTVTRADSVQVRVPEAQGPVRAKTDVMLSQLTPNAQTITRVDR
jgi:hypothetical protein